MNKPKVPAAKYLLKGPESEAGTHLYIDDVAFQFLDKKSGYRTWKPLGSQKGVEKPGTGFHFLRWLVRSSKA